MNLIFQQKQLDDLFDGINSDIKERVRIKIKKRIINLLL